MDERDRWMGIKRLKQGYQPRPYIRKNRFGERIGLAFQAEAAADYLEQVQWKKQQNQEEEEINDMTRQYHLNNERVNNWEPEYNVSEITEGEVW